MVSQGAEIRSQLSLQAEAERDSRPGFSAQPTSQNRASQQQVPARAEEVPKGSHQACPSVENLLDEV